MARQMVRTFTRYSCSAYAGPEYDGPIYAHGSHRNLHYEHVRYAPLMGVLRLTRNVVGEVHGSTIAGLKASAVKCFTAGRDRTSGRCEQPAHLCGAADRQVFGSRSDEE